jgi:RNA polymerase sigma-70 factor (ECF subfamily)
MRTVEVLDKTADLGELRSEPEGLADIYRSHGEFVWACLQRFGVRDRDLEDTLQEVFVVVHQRLATFRGEARLTTWLYAICLRVAAAHRRRGYVARETQVDEPFETAALDQSSPEDEVLLMQRRRVLERILDELDLEKRALLVMFEIDELPCEEIASILGVPLGTVYSRLHGARKAFEKAVARFRARSRGALG